MGVQGSPSGGFIFLRGKGGIEFRKLLGPCGLALVKSV